MSLTSIHFVGIGGIGMSGIAEILVRSGYRVFGSDLRENRETENLKKLGVVIYQGHRRAHVQKVDTVVISSAISPTNPEVLEAKRRHIPILSRAQMLAELMRKKQSIVVAGAHGKTTTSAMIATLLFEAGIDPTVVIGGRVNRMGGNAKMGSDNWFVAESDESDGSFLTLLPTYAVITNLDREHMDHYGSYAALEQAFVDFANRVPFDGTVVVCADDPGVEKIISRIEKPILTYGFSPQADVRGTELSLQSSEIRFRAFQGKQEIGEITLPVTGKHNAFNALGCISMGILLEISTSHILHSLNTFEGIGRRLEKKGCFRGIQIIDDYAHHPTEIRVTLDALQLMKGKGNLRVLFQPHRYSRVGDLWDLFSSVFVGVDELVVLPIYAASEKPMAGISSEKLVEAIRETSQGKVRYASSMEEGAQAICEEAKEGDILVTMGAGDITKAGGILSQILEPSLERETTKP